MISGNALSGVKVSVSNGAGSFTTDSNGNYGFLGLDPGTYTVAPSKTGYTFTPPSRTVTLPPDAEHIDFSSTAVPTTFSIQGSISKDGFAVPGVKLFITTGGIQFDSTTTGQDGKFSFANLHAGEYTLRPGLAGYTFSPASSTVTVPPDATAVNFTATALQTTSSIQGSISKDGSALPGVTIHLTTGGQQFDNTTTGNDGRFAFSGLHFGEYTVRPELTGYTFSPVSRTVNVPPDATGQDFNGTANSNPPPIVLLPGVMGTLLRNDLQSSVGCDASRSGTIWIQWDKLKALDPLYLNDQGNGQRNKCDDIQPDGRMNIRLAIPHFPDQDIKPYEKFVDEATHRGIHGP